jgi:hypothetical protein
VAASFSGAAEKPRQVTCPLHWNFFRFGGVLTNKGRAMTFILWCILFVLCWPLALLALVLYPFVWLVLLPFRIVGIAVGGVLELLRAIITLPARALRGGHRA